MFRCVFEAFERISYALRTNFIGICHWGLEQLGAQRFMRYWESRQEVFGPDKFALHLTLNEALCDDSAALESCVLSPLPRLDASGRQLLFFF
jgi:hypothetical protein